MSQTGDNFLLSKHSRESIMTKDIDAWRMALLELADRDIPQEYQSLESAKISKL